jgi:hypothetical protein
VNMIRKLIVIECILAALTIASIVVLAVLGL